MDRTFYNQGFVDTCRCKPACDEDDGCFSVYFWKDIAAVNRYTNTVKMMGGEKVTLTSGRFSEFLRRYAEWLEK